MRAGGGRGEKSLMCALRLASYKCFYVCWHYIELTMSQLRKEGGNEAPKVKALPRVTQLLRGGAKTQSRPPTPLELILHSHTRTRLEANLSLCLAIRRPGFRVDGEGKPTRPESTAGLLIT